MLSDNRKLKGGKDIKIKISVLKAVGLMMLPELIIFFKYTDIKIRLLNMNDDAIQIVDGNSLLLEE